MNPFNSPLHNSGGWAPRARADLRNITVREAVDEYLDYMRVSGLKTREHRSVLKGAEKRLYGKKAAGSALSQTYLGPMPVRRVTWREYRDWFDQRHPDTLAPSSRKRGMSSMRGFLRFCVAVGWADSDVLHACSTITASPARRDWLRPEVLKAITPLLAREDDFDEMDRFGWEVMLATGVRISELIEIQESDLNYQDGTLHVVGKGRGRGKPRDIPVDDDFIERFEAYCRRMRIAPGSYLFYFRRFVAAKGQPRGVMALAEEDRSRHIGPKPFYKMCEKLLELAPEHLDRDLQPTALTPHVLRHTYGCLHTIAAELNTAGQGTALGMHSLMKAMGHESLETTALYLGDVANYMAKYRRLNSTERTIEDILTWVRKQAG